MQDPQGEGRFRWLGIAISIMSHAILLAVLLTLGAVAAGLVAGFLGYLFVRTPGNPGRRP